MAQIGLGKGLAVQHDFAADINRLYQRESMRQQVRVEQERKAQMYGEMLKKGHVKGAYLTKRLEEYYDQTNQELATFVTDNPDWETDPGKFAKFAEISDRYLNNDIIREDQQVQQQFQALQQEVTRGTMSYEEIETQMDAYNEYINNGGDPYVFINTKKYEFNDILKESVDNVGMFETIERRPTPSGLTGLFQVRKPKVGALSESVKTAFSDPEKKRQIIAAFSEDQNKTTNNVYQWYENKISSRLDMQDAFVNYDSHERAVAEKRLSNPDLQSRFGTDVFLPLMDAWENGVDPKIDPSNSHLALTLFGGKSSTNTISKDSKFRWKNGAAFEGNVSATSTGSQKIVMIDGMPYVQTDVSVVLPIDPIDEKKKKDTVDTFEKELLANDFTIGAATLEGGYIDVGLGGKSVKAKKYTGMLLAPLILTEATMDAYDDIPFSDSEMKYFHENPWIYQSMREEAQNFPKFVKSVQSELQKDVTRLQSDDKYSWISWKTQGLKVVGVAGKKRFIYDYDGSVYGTPGAVLEIE